MSSSFATFSFPTTTLFGKDAIFELPRRLKGCSLGRPLIVTDPGLLQTHAFQQLQKALGSDGDAGEWRLFSGVHPNPIEQDVIAAATAFRERNCDAIIAFGGGSALDVGKAARLLIKRPQLKLSEFNFDEDWSGLAPCLCIPTTAGTGSEVGRSSVITIEKTRRKKVFFHPKLLADFVILDPELTRGLPPRLTAATGADALVHCLESFTSPVFHPLCDGVALEGLRLIIDALPRAFRDGNDLEARGAMLVAAAMGAVAFQKDLGVTHSMAHPLSTLFGMHHGTANALCLPVAMRFNAERKQGLYRRIGIACGLDLFRRSDAEADRLTIEFLSEFLIQLELRPGLRAFGVKESDIEALSAEAIEDSCHRTNPVPITRDNLRQLYLSAL